MSDDRSDDEPAATEPTPDEAASTDGRAEYDAREDLPDVKTDDRGQPIKRSVHPVEWEAVGRDAIADLLETQRDAVERDVGEVIATLDVGTPVDPVHLIHVRDAIEALEVTVEERLAPVTREKEPWERTVERVPDHRLLDALGLDREAVERLRERQEGDDAVP